MDPMIPKEMKYNLHYGDVTSERKERGFGPAFLGLQGEYINHCFKSVSSCNV